MRILSIDHGTRTGYAVVDGRELRRYDSFILHNEPIENKFTEFEKMVSYLIEAYTPDLILLERASDMTGATVARYLIGLNVIATLCAAREGIPIIQCHRSSVCKAVTGYGKSTKDQVAESVCKFFGLNFADIQHTVYKVKTKKNKVGDVKEKFYDEYDAMAMIIFYLMNKDKEIGNNTKID